MMPSNGLGTAQGNPALNMSVPPNATFMPMPGHNFDGNIQYMGLNPNQIQRNPGQMQTGPYG